MTIFSTHDLKKDLRRIKSISQTLEKKMKNASSEEKRLDNLSEEELQDLNKIVNLADYVLTKHETKKEFHEILKEFVQMIHESANSIESLNDEIDEMIYFAEDGLGKIKDIQNSIADRYAIPKVQKLPNPENGANNLTKSSIPVYTHEYQPKSEVETGQVI